MGESCRKIVDPDLKAVHKNVLDFIGDIEEDLDIPKFSMDKPKEFLCNLGVRQTRIHMTTLVEPSILLTDIATISASVIAAIAFIVSSLTYVQTSYRERRTKTLDYWETVQPSLIEARKSLSAIHTGVWSSADAREHLNSPNFQLITEGINVFERLATGVNLDIYDLKVLNKLGGKMILDSYVAYAPIIAVREEQLGSNNSFHEFKLLYGKLEKLRS